MTARHYLPVTDRQLVVLVADQMCRGDESTDARNLWQASAQIRERIVAQAVERGKEDGER